MIIKNQDDNDVKISPWIVKLHYRGNIENGDVSTRQLSRVTQNPNSYYLGSWQVDESSGIDEGIIEVHIFLEYNYHK